MKQEFHCGKVSEVSIKIFQNEFLAYSDLNAALDALLKRPISL